MSHKEIKVCVYDNPDTMHRECWQNKKINSILFITNHR